MAFQNASDGRPRDTKEREKPAEVDSATCFELLADPERRVLLSYCIERSNTATEVSELIDHINSTLSTRSTRSDIRTTLRYVHLPKLAGANVIDYDVDSRAVTYLGSDTIERVLAAVAQQ